VSCSACSFYPLENREEREKFTAIKKKKGKKKDAGTTSSLLELWEGKKEGGKKRTRRTEKQQRKGRGEDRLFNFCQAKRKEKQRTPG